MPPASRVSDMHTCPMVTVLVPHVGGPILPPGAVTVLIGMLPAARVTDMCVCVGPPDIIVKGSAGVFINYLPAARIGDMTAHGGVIILGEPTVIIGEIGSPQGGGGGAPAPGLGGLAGMLGGLISSMVDAVIDAAKSIYSAVTNDPITPSLQKDIDKSPTLKRQIEDLKQKGWKFKYGESGKGTFADRNTKTITIDPAMANDNASSLTYISHEVGHAERPAPTQVPMGNLSKQDYVDQNVHQSLLDESDATINNIKVKEELQQNGGPNIAIAGAQGQKYQQYYDNDPSTARENIANDFGSGEHPSNSPNQTYSQYYGKPYADAYDQAHPPGAGGP